MTNHWIDFRNADVILVMGSNIAENHPVGMKWIMEAKDRRNAKLIVVDPRFTRTASVADLFVPLRPGTDIAVYGGLINFILENRLHFEEWILHYTNASFLVNPGFRMPGELNGLFSGWDIQTNSYDKETWAFQRDESGIIRRDDTLTDRNCVFQLLKKHYGRYTPQLVSEISGAPREKLLAFYRMFASTGRPDKAAAILYAMGATQHTVGAQYIRAMSIVQLLLGNIGVAGGGVAALRGESNVQGSTDHGLLFNTYPGYLKAVTSDLPDLKSYLDRHTPRYADARSVNWWKNYPKYFISFLKAMYGTAATGQNDFRFSFLPKLEHGKNYSWLHLFDAMARGEIKGFFAWGQNPACSSANAGMVRKALAKLDWMVAVNPFDNETASFFKGPGVNAKEIRTEVYLLPAAMFCEKEGSVTNSGRLAQWRYKAAEPPGSAKTDADIINGLFLKIRDLYAGEGGALPEPILKLNWSYGEVAADIHAVAMEINGQRIEEAAEKNPAMTTAADPGKGRQVDSFSSLRDDGRTACGNWLYCQSYNDRGNNMARRGGADPTGIGLYPDFAWSWPLNRRILYNRASVNREGEPFDKSRAVIRWEGNRWIGDVPDGGAPPMADRRNGSYPFIMKTEGMGALFGPGMIDGPFPEHYEPFESPVETNLLSGTRVSPTAMVLENGSTGLDHPGRPSRYPCVGMTYRVSKHWQTGVMTRRVPLLLELQPQMFVEIGGQLAAEKGIKSRDRVRVSTARGNVEGVAIVSGRIPSYKIGNRTIHVVGLPWCFGWQTPRKAGDSANLLTPSVGDGNTFIPETKAFMLDIVKL